MQNCKNEFDYAIRRHGAAKVLPVVMEPACKDTSAWHGAVGFKLGGQLYHDMSADGAPEDMRRIAQLSNAIKRRLGGAQSSGRILKRASSGFWLPKRTSGDRNTGGGREGEDAGTADSDAVEKPRPSTTSWITGGLFDPSAVMRSFYPSGGAKPAASIDAPRPARV